MTPPADLNQTVAHALAEDIGTGDITAALIPADKHSRATVICREAAMLCGIPWFNAVFAQLDDHIKIIWHKTEGEAVVAGDVLCHIQGHARALLTGERCALNFLQTLSATATITRHYVALLQNTDVTLLDTRKTIPLLRHAQKYAVRCGGGQNHRMGLYDAFLIKENHIAAAGSIAHAVRQARQIKNAAIEVEVENLEQLQQALELKVESVLLDNFSLEAMRQAVAINRHTTAGKTKLEASGGVNEATLWAIAQTGVDYISIGGLTKHVQAIDLSMRFMD